MKVVVLSDTHAKGLKDLPERILEDLKRADLIIHAGDPKFNTPHVIKAFIGLILNINVCESNLFILSLFIMAFSL